MEPNSNILESQHFTFVRFAKLQWLHQRYLKCFYWYLLNIAPTFIMTLISWSILNHKFIGAPWPYARLGLQGPAYLHKIKTSHGLKIINCIKIRTDRDGPFLGAKTLLWKIINNVISNTNQKGVSRDRRWNENYLSAIICHLHSENWFRHICQTCQQDIWKLFAYPYGQSLSVILEPIIFTSKLITKPTNQSVCNLDQVNSSP